MSEVATPQLSPEMQRHYAMAFNEPIPEAAQVNEPPAGELGGDSQAGSTNEPLAGDQGSQQPGSGASAGTNEAAETIYDPNDYIKEHLGFDNWETAKEEISRLRQLQETANQPKEIKYSNEYSKRIHEYLEAGKEDELWENLNARRTVRGLDGMNDEQKVKLFIKMNNPMFDQELIDYQFQQDYGFDESRFKDENGVILDPLAYRHAKIASLQKMQGDLAKANEFFNNYKTKIELPQISPAQQAAIVDEAYESYKARTAEATEAYNKTIAPALQSLVESDVNMAFNINDSENHMNFDFGITVDKADFDAAKQDALFYSDWVEKTFYDKGVFQPKKLARAILLERNFDKYVQTIARQSVNAERKRVIEKETPGVTRKGFDVGSPEKSELDKRMEMAFSV